jgi:hypothetical protein
MRKNNKIVPEIGDYVRCVYVIADRDKEVLNRIFKVTEVHELRQDNFGNANADIYVEENHFNDGWYLTVCQVEVIAKEIYNSPLFNALKEE